MTKKGSPRYSCRGYTVPPPY